jgi:hypothetical protein
MAQRASKRIPLDQAAPAQKQPVLVAPLPRRAALRQILRDLLVSHLEVICKPILQLDTLHILLLRDAPTTTDDQKKFKRMPTYR